MAQYGKPNYWDERYTKGKCAIADPGAFRNLIFTTISNTNRRTSFFHPPDPEPFDWYQRYSGIKEILSTYLQKTDHMLMTGCGNSREYPLFKFQFQRSID